MLRTGFRDGFQERLREGLEHVGFVDGTRIEHHIGRRAVRENVYALALPYLRPCFECSLSIVTSELIIPDHAAEKPCVSRGYPVVPVNGDLCQRTDVDLELVVSRNVLCKHIVKAVYALDHQDLILLQRCDALAEYLCAVNEVELRYIHFLARKQIFHLRETRMYLINGEVEHAPADGEAMRLVFDELDRQEQALTELFIGKKSKHTEHKRVQFTPEQKRQIWYFSEGNGFTDAENVDANTIVASVAVQPQQYVSTTTDKKKKAAEPSSLVYNLPGNGEVKVLYKGKELAKRTIAIAQLGIDVPLAKDLFKGNSLPVIVVSEKTGNIVSISK